MNEPKPVYFNAVEVPFIAIEEVLGSYEEDQFFGPILKALRNGWPQDEVKKNQVQMLLPSFRHERKKLFYFDKLCIPRKAVAKILELAHDSTIGGHFRFAKTISRLAKYHWRHKSRDVNNYIQGCLQCQQKHYHGTKKLTEPIPLEIPKRIWGSVATDFIVRLPKTDTGYDSITTFVERLSRRVRFVPSNTSDTKKTLSR